MRTIALYTTETMADWEYAYLTTQIAGAEHLKPERFRLLLPGADHYAAGHERLIEAVGHLVDKEIPVAAICGATLLLARGGFLDERHHTSNAASYLEASGYRGGAHYVEAPVATNRGITTASGIHAVPFTAEVMRITGLVPDAMVDSWEQVFLNGKEKDYMALMEATVAWQNA